MEAILSETYYYPLALRRAEELAALYGVETMAGLNVLDICCGSGESTKREGVSDPDVFVGLFVLGCSRLGAANIYGIDLLPQDQRLVDVYHHITGNITRQVLSDLVGGDIKFHIININKLFKGPNPSPTLMETLPEGLSLKQLYQQMLLQTKAVCDKNCILAIEENVYRHKDGVWYIATTELW